MQNLKPLCAIADVDKFGSVYVTIKDNDTMDRHPMSSWQNLIVNQIPYVPMKVWILTLLAFSLGGLFGGIWIGIAMATT